MSQLPIARRRILTVGAAGTLAVLLSPEAAFAKNTREVELLRWDLIVIDSSGAILPGGTNVARDAATKDTIDLTGSGQAEPKEHSAAGGGTFIHRHANGSKVTHGIYYVTGFKSFVNAGGTLVGTLPIDGIGELEETTGGILKLRVHLIPSSGRSVEGVLGVYCTLPGTTDSSIIEGETLSIPSLNLNFVQEPNGGDNLFHVLDR
jgi:hypothetical protein